MPRCSSTRLEISSIDACVVLSIGMCCARNRASAAATSRLHVSSVDDGLDLRIDVLMQHAYTTELRMTYGFRDPQTGEPDPSAFLRLYSDARQVEATHCYVGRRWQDVIGMYPPPAAVLDHRMRMNTFLGKWLQYLAERGHGVATLHATDGNAAVCLLARQ